MEKWFDFNMLCFRKLLGLYILVKSQKAKDPRPKDGGLDVEPR